MTDQTKHTDRPSGPAGELSTHTIRAWSGAYVVEPIRSQAVRGVTRRRTSDDCTAGRCGRQVIVIAISSAPTIWRSRVSVW